MLEHKAAKVIKLTPARAVCQDCILYQLCLPTGLDPTALDSLNRIIKKRRLLKAGEHLFRRGDVFASIYAVKSGSFKTFNFAEDGSEQVTGLHLPGELFGLDAISVESHCCDAVALEPSAVCEIPFDRLEALVGQIPSLMRNMLRIMSKEIVRDKRVMQTSKAGAEGRLAAFLLSIGERFQERGFACDEYRLSMSRVDIGNYLGLADETVSRLFTRFKEDGLLMVDRRHIRLIDIPRLRTLAYGAGAQEDGLRLLAWDPLYSIGVEVIDQQHERLFAICNRLYDAWRRHAGKTVLGAILDELIDYTHYHFTEEEGLMQQIGYPDLPQHRQAHEELVHLVREYRAQLAAGSKGVETQVLELVKTWLNIHVLEDDRDIGDHLRRTSLQTA